MSDTRDTNTGEPPNKRLRQTLSADEATETSYIFEKIAPDGDVVFVFEDGMKKLQVHSFMLKHVSPTFSVMLGGNFKEGRMLQEAALDQRQPVEIPLPEDDFEALKAICIVIHSPGLTKKHAPDVDMLIRIFEAADKYDMFDAISLSFEVWARKHLSDKTGDKHLWLLMVVSYQIKAYELFQDFSRGLVFGTKRSFMPLAAHSETRLRHLVPDSLHYKLAVSLEEMRTLVLQEILSIINDPMYKLFSSGDRDDEIYKTVLPYYRHLGEVFMQEGTNDKNGLYRVGGGFSVQQLVDQIERFAAVTPTAIRPTAICPTCSRLHSQRDKDKDPPLPNSWYQTLIGSVRKVEEDFQGCCILCVSDGALRYHCTSHNAEK